MNHWIASHDHGTSKQTIKNVPHRHAFALVGEKNLFLCHQIMSHMEAHCFEIILEVKLPEETKEAIFENRKMGYSHYLCNQQGGEFTVASIVAGSRQSFTANVWTGVPDSNPPAVMPQPPWGKGPDGKPVPPWRTDVTVEIIRIVHFRHLNRNETSRRFEEYILFGRGKEAHIMHSVLWQPDYDHLASLRKAPDWISEEQLIATINVSFPELPFDPWGTYCNCPLHDNSVHEVYYFGFTEFRDPEGNVQNHIEKLEIHVDHTWWYSTKITNYWRAQHCANNIQIS